MSHDTLTLPENSTPQERAVFYRETLKSLIVSSAVTQKTLVYAWNLFLQLQLAKSAIINMPEDGVYYLFDILDDFQEGIPADHGSCELAEIDIYSNFFDKTGSLGRFTILTDLPDEEIERARVFSEEMRKVAISPWTLRDYPEDIE